MDVVFTVVLVVHVLLAAAIVGLVLLQHGKGADMGAAFGSGSSGSLFGATGSANFLSRTTAVLATVFFATSLALTWLASHNRGIEPASIMKGAAESTPARAPAKEAPKNNAAPQSNAAPPSNAASEGKTQATPGQGAPKADEVPK